MRNLLQAWVVLLASVTVVSNWTISGRRYVFKLISSIHHCDMNLIYVASEDLGPEGCPCHLRTLGLSFMTTRTFLSFNLTDYSSRYRCPRCIAIFPDNSSGLTEVPKLIQKVRKEFDTFVSLWRIPKPKIIFIFPQLLEKHCPIIQRDKFIHSFLPENTTGFRINTDIYTIFTSYNVISQHFQAAIWEVYRIRDKVYYKRLNIPHEFTEKVAQESEEVFYYDRLDNKAERRGDFEGVGIVHSTRDDSSSSWITIKKIEGRRTLVGGSYASYYFDLQKMLNFTMEIILGENIVTLPNNTLTGKTLTQLNSGEADIALSQSLVIYFRATEMGFLQPTYYTLIHVFFQQPTANSLRNIVTAPFQTLLWVTLIATWVLIIVTVKIGTYLKRCSASEETVEGDTEEKLVFERDMEFAKAVGMWAVAANSTFASPKSTSLKMVFLFGTLCGVVVYVAYSAAVVSSLAVTFVPVQHFVDLITHNFVFTVHRKSEPFQLILKHLIDLFGLSQDVVKVDTVQEISHLLDPSTPKAFLTYQDLFYQTALQLNYTEAFVCNKLSKVQVSDFQYKTAIFVRKGSEFTEIFNHKIIQLRERGFNFRYVFHYERQNVFSCTKQLQRHKVVEPLRFIDVLTAFLVVFCGLVISSVLLVYETLLHRAKRRKNASAK